MHRDLRFVCRKTCCFFVNFLVFHPVFSQNQVSTANEWILIEVVVSEVTNMNEQNIRRLSSTSSLNSCNGSQRLQSSDSPSPAETVSFTNLLNSTFSFVIVSSNFFLVILCSLLSQVDISHSMICVSIHLCLHLCLMPLLHALMFLLPNPLSVVCRLCLASFRETLCKSLCTIVTVCVLKSALSS